MSLGFLLSERACAGSAFFVRIRTRSTVYSIGLGEAEPGSLLDRIQVHIDISGCIPTDPDLLITIADHKYRTGYAVQCLS